MTDREVMQQALRALCNSIPTPLTTDCEYAEGSWQLRREAIKSLVAAIAQPEQPAWLLTTTQNLAKSIARRCYPDVPQFQVLNDLAGVISQIDNMTIGMDRKNIAQPKDKP